MESCYTNRVMQITTSSGQATKDAGKKFAATLKGGDIVCLYGELGAGKTTFVKGVAEGLGISENITSPTFILMNIYKTPPLLGKRRGAGLLVHIDTYRLKNEQEFLDIGATDYLGEPDVIAIIEWPEKIAGLLKEKKVINVSIDRREENTRSITIV